MLQGTTQVERIISHMSDAEPSPAGRKVKTGAELIFTKTEKSFTTTQSIQHIYSRRELRKLFRINLDNPDQVGGQKIFI